MKPIPSFLIATHARSDLSRITNELYTLQRQTSSNLKADDLKGYGAESARIITARTAIAQSTSRVDAANRLVTRFEVQDTALGQVASAAAQLKSDIFTALSADDGTYLSGQLDIAFQQANTGLNTTYEGQTLFTGDRRNGTPVAVTQVTDIRARLNNATLFDESTRSQTVDLGVGAPVVAADKASDIASKLYGAFADLSDLVQSGGLDKPLTADARARLQTLSAAIDDAHRQVVDAQGRNGDAQKSVESTVTRLTTNADLLTKHLGKIADVDLAEVAVKLAAAQTQYQASASVFSQLKDLSLVNFLN